MSSYHSKICVVVKSDSIEGILDRLKGVSPDAGFVELRCDYLKEGFDLSSLEKVRKSIKQKAIFTCRLTRFGGEFPKSPAEWRKVVQTADTAKFDYIDIDYGLTAELDYNNFKKSLRFAKTILSYHNFTHTPPYLKLKKILRKMDGLSPEICKFATKVNKSRDVDDILKLILNKKKKTKIISLGMGSLGVKTRVLTPLLGAELTFASLEEGQETADGQLSFNELSNRIEKIAELLN
jgi:3-dehydroquinate dehydratase type I